MRQYKEPECRRSSATSSGERRGKGLYHRVSECGRISDLEPDTTSVNCFCAAVFDGAVGAFFSSMKKSRGY